MESIPFYISYPFLVVFALAIGSLLNVVIYRLPLMLKREWQAECSCLLDLPPPESKDTFNLFWPRSRCPQCNTLIAAYDNIPVLSFLWLKGKCRHCDNKISAQYPLVEMCSALLCALAAWHFGFTLQLLFACFFIWLVIPIAIIDLHEQIIPDSLCYSLLWLGLIANIQSLFTPLDMAVISTVLAWLSLWLFIKVFYLLTGKVGMGHGDFKLFAAFGAWFGWMALPLILLCSSLIGAIIGMVYLRLSKQSKNTPVPFGPFLCFAGLLYLFWGEQIIAWYLQFY